MKIIVVGNINSGKSFLVDKISQAFEDFKVLKIDDFREKLGDGTIDKEVLIWEIFSKEVQKTKNAIVEITGVGKPSEELAKNNEDSVILVKVLTKKSVCLERLKQKDFTSLKYPKGLQKIEDTISSIDLKIGKGEVEKLFLDNVKAVIEVDFQKIRVSEIVEKIKKELC